MTTFGLVAIVKDERANLPAFLASAQRYCTTATIVDTGSTDGTPDLAGELWPGARVLSVEWDGFGPARTAAFTAAHGAADWLLALDADMTVEIDEGWEPDPGVDAYAVSMGNGGAFTWRLPLVLNGSVTFASIGRCHEYTARADGRDMRVVPTDAVRVRYPDRSSPAKTEWQLELLRRDLAERPDDPRTIFYIAQTLRDAGRPLEARHLYLRRAGMGGWEPERWYAQYRAALLTDWPARAGELLAAWEARPTRLEPVVALLRDLNSRSMHRSAWALAESAWTGTPPADDLFVDRSAWPQVLAEMGIAGWYTGRRDWSKRIGRMALDSADLSPAWRAATERNVELAA